MPAPPGTVLIAGCKIRGKDLSSGAVGLNFTRADYTSSDYSKLASLVVAAKNMNATHIEIFADPDTSKAPWHWIKDANQPGTSASGPANHGATLLLTSAAKWKSNNAGFLKVPAHDVTGTAQTGMNGVATASEADCLAKVHSSPSNVALYEPAKKLCHGKVMGGNSLRENTKFDAYFKILEGPAGGGSVAGGCKDWSNKICRDNCATNGGCLNMFNSFCKVGDRILKHGLCKATPPEKAAGKAAQIKQAMKYCGMGTNVNNAMCKNYCTASTGQKVSGDDGRKQACNALYATKCKVAANKKLPVCCQYKKVSDFPDLAREVQAAPGIVPDLRCIEENCVKTGYLDRPRAELACTQKICSNRVYFEKKPVVADNIEQICRIEEAPAPGSSSPAVPGATPATTPSSSMLMFAAAVCVLLMSCMFSASAAVLMM